jgi:hypothetical protein
MNTGTLFLFTVIAISTGELPKNNHPALKTEDGTFCSRSF